MKLSVPEYILALKPYLPGKPLEELQRESGIINAVKLASNENPLGPSPMAAAAIREAVGKLNRYPDGGGYDLIHCIAEKFSIAADNIVLGNGSDDIIVMLARVLLRPSDEVILPRPSFLFYEIAVTSAGAIPIWVPLKAHATDLAGILRNLTPRTRMIFLNNPHNPTGAVISQSDFQEFITSIPSDTVIVLDEAYIEFVREPGCVSCFEYLNCGKLVVGMRTFSKAYGLAGLRIGYGVMPPFLADLLNRVRQPFNVNSLAQVAAVAALKDEDFLQQSIQLVHRELDFMYDYLAGLGIGYLRSQANFLLIEVGKNADHIFNELLKRGVIVRSMASYGLADYIRVNVGLHEENVRFLEALADFV